MNFVFTGSNNSKVFYSVRTKKNLCMHTHMQMHTHRPTQRDEDIWLRENAYKLVS